MFFEEPVPPDNLDALKAVKDKSPVSISAGERLYTRCDYKKMFDLMATDYIQPDISHAGGIVKLKTIAADQGLGIKIFENPLNDFSRVINTTGVELVGDGGNTIQL